jgi:hypothetical protein
VALPALLGGDPGSAPVVVPDPQAARPSATTNPAAKAAELERNL